VARDEAIRTIRAEILSENTAMQKICAGLGFVLEAHPTGGTIRARLELP
jgi:RimJ/RimL family protein N-acetyltransferase